MMVDKRIQEVLKKPAVYLQHYQNVYSNTVDCIEQLKKDGVDDIYLIHIYNSLAYVAGKRALVYGLNNGISEFVIIRLWNELHSRYELADLSEEDAKNFKDFIVKIEKEVGLK